VDNVRGYDTQDTGRPSHSLAVAYSSKRRNTIKLLTLFTTALITLIQQSESVVWISAINDANELHGIKILK